ncbi:hypothetical protein, partial [Microseira wollei]|uniref:hypothetical protein n=1 Tax=Microseira wollei TaxID=467598 RepID=UPI001CFF14D6
LPCPYPRTAAAIWGINQQITVAVPLPQDGGGNLGHQPTDYGCPAPTPGRKPTMRLTNSAPGDMADEM